MQGKEALGTSLLAKLNGLVRSRDGTAQCGLRAREGTLRGLWVGGEENIQEGPKRIKVCRWGVVSPLLYMVEEKARRQLKSEPATLSSASATGRLLYDVQCTGGWYTRDL